MVPLSMGELHELVELDVRNNKVESMPEELAGLRSLRSLQAQVWADLRGLAVLHFPLNGHLRGML